MPSIFLWGGVNFSTQKRIQTHTYAHLIHTGSEKVQNRHSTWCVYVWLLVSTARKCKHVKYEPIEIGGTMAVAVGISHCGM